MKKLLFYSLFVVSALSSCSKDDPAPSANVEGKWNLSTADVEVKSLLGDEKNNLDFKNQGVYLELKANNKFSGNIVMADDLAYFVDAGDVYESDYEVKGKEITLQVYDTAYETYVPVKLKIESSTDSELVLKMTKAELAETMKAYDKLDGSTDFTDMMSIIASVDAVLKFTK